MRTLEAPHGLTDSRAMIARLVFLLILSTHIAAPLRAERVLTVFAAASLGGVLEEIVQDYPQQVVFSYGGSGAMARQVAAGAPADLVVLANPIWMEWLQDQGVAMQGTPVSIARNRLALIAGPAVQAGLEPGRVQDLLGDDYLAIGQRNTVPAGIYARQWLQKTGQWDALEPHLAETDNVRAALALVAQGQAPAGIVYVTDAQAQPKVKILHIIEPGVHDPITYPAAALTPEGAALLSHFTKDPAQAIFAAHGFQDATP